MARHLEIAAPILQSVQGVKTTYPLVALTGRAGSGKSTLAQQLEEQHGFKRVRFAGPLKDMLRAIGLSEAEIEGELKETPCAMLGGKTPRHAMQTLGTEWGRECIDPAFWTRMWARRVALADGPVVVEDCRFENEAAIVRQMGGVVVWVATSDDALRERVGHVSENGVECDVRVWNHKKTPQEFLEYFIEMIKPFAEPAPVSADTARNLLNALSKDDKKPTQ